MTEQTTTEAAPAPPQRWDPLSLEQVQELFSGVSAPWWIAGGQALDLFVGHETRSHLDIDIAILRTDQKVFRERLGKWDVQIAHAGAFLPWKRGETITAPEHHEVWARETPNGPWRIELLLEESEGRHWRYRRDPRIGMNIADLGLRDDRGISYVRPEVTLLYKSTSPRAVDETDLLYVLPRLNPAQRSWLFATIYTADPRHRWLERLTSGTPYVAKAPE